MYLYSPKDVIILLGGFYPVEGYSSDTFIRIKKDVKPFESMSSMDGETSRIYRKDDGYVVEITLAQSSPTNDILSTLYNIDVATQVGKFPLLIKDTKGTTTFFAATAWIENIPDVSFSGDLTERTWVIGTSEAGLNVGGNANDLVLQITGLASASLPLLSQLGVI